MSVRLNRVAHAFGGRPGPSGLRRSGIILCFLLGLGVLIAAPPGRAQADVAAAPEVHLLTIEGVINPLTAQYLERGLRDGAGAGVAAVLVRLNTPGGLESSMREMVQDMLASTVPVVVYVTPSGGRAASAGMFLTIAAHVAAMAPGTNIGAAHPVGLGGETDPVMAEKMANDAAALARSTAVVRGRNAEWAERAVRESVSITAEEARQENVIDLVSGDLQELLRLLDGRTVRVAGAEVVLRTEGASVVERPMTFLERLLHVVTDPNIAYILFTIGTIGIIAELYNPGVLLPGILGVTSLVLAFVGFGNLPINWAGVFLLLLAVGLFVAELLVAGFGVLSVGGLITFVAGSLLLFSPFAPVSPAMPEVAVNRGLIAGAAAGTGVFFLVVLRAVLRTRTVPASSGREALAGRTAVALSALRPHGTVTLDSEVWSAVAEEGAVGPGEVVDVLGVEGVTLRVRKRVAG